MHHKVDILKELSRKSIHLSSIWIPLSLLYYPVNLMRGIFIILFLGLFIFDKIRISPSTLGQTTRKLLKILKLELVFREHEKTRLSGATYMLLSASLCSIMFSKEVFIVSFTVLILADTMAAIIGKSFGKHRIGTKTLEGSIAFFLTSMLVGEVMYLCFLQEIGLTLVAILLASLCTTLVELYAKKLRLDDNLTIPLSYGILLTLYNYYIFYS